MFHVKHLVLFVGIDNIVWNNFVASLDIFGKNALSDSRF